MAKLTVYDHYDLAEERDPPSAAVLYVDRDGDLVLEMQEDDAVYLSPEGARLLAVALLHLADEVEAGA